MVICLERGAGLHMAQLMPLPLTVSCFSKVEIGFTFLVLAHQGSPGQWAIKRVCVCFRRATQKRVFDEDAFSVTYLWCENWAGQYTETPEAIGIKSVDFSDFSVNNLSYESQGLNKLRMCMALTHAWATERLEASSWQTKDNMAVDSRLRPPSCSEYWSVHCLATSSRQLYV